MYNYFLLFLKNLFIFFLLNIFLLTSYLNATNNEILLYNTTSGIYQATLIKIPPYLMNNNETKFLHKLENVPYAEPPQRFKQSVLRKYRSGINKNKQNVFCHQQSNLNAYGYFHLKYVPEITNDCLIITLYIPQAKTELEKKEMTNMPVIVHIHGGSNMVGGAALFDGSILASQGKVIVATINYRLGILGFLSDMTEKYPGNFGLRDQILAIKWLKLNCPVLNCNPDLITLWGHSAGAGDVNWLAMSPFSNKLFKRAIIQSGSAFSFWGSDRLPQERYKSFRIFFNCTHLPEEHTKENKGMTRLIDECLLNLNENKLLQFRFALIDAPGPTYDGFLGENALITVNSPTEYLKQKHILDIDIMTGINSAEGFAFEGYFSQSVNFWASENLTNEVIVTLERFSLLVKERCKQNSIIENRIKLEKYYENKCNGYLKFDNNRQTEKRMRTIFSNSDAIFDAGFIVFLKSLIQHTENKARIYVYEYLHESACSFQTIRSMFQFSKENISISTHFDGIDLAFGLPIGYFLLSKDSKKEGSIFKEGYVHWKDFKTFEANQPKRNYELPFEVFSFDCPSNNEDVKMSEIMMTYFTNFVKTGDPNKGEKVPRTWNEYNANRSYLKLDKTLINNIYNDSSISDMNIREELYKIWHLDMEKDGYCEQFDEKSKFYDSKNHTSGKNVQLENCFNLLQTSIEYNNLRENFLQEYEICVDEYENKYTKIMENSVTIYCLDAIAVRRMMIEYNVCCLNRESKNSYSTICEYNNFSQDYLNATILEIVKKAIKKEIANKYTNKNLPDLLIIIFCLFAYYFFVKK